MDLWFLVRGNEELQIDRPGAAGALAIFTSQDAAESYKPYAKSYGHLESGDQWEVVSMNGKNALKILADLGTEAEPGISHVVIDPTPDGGRVLAFFEALVELQ